MNEPEDDFAALFEASLQAPRFTRGQTVEGRVVAIGTEVVFVDVGGKGEAQLAVDEVRDETGAVEVQVGDRIKAVVVSTEGGVVLSRTLARAAADAAQVEDAYHAGLPVEGKVEGVGKGGYEVRLGRQRAFCPFSQIDVARTADPADHLGRVYAFRIVEYRDGGRSIVVSRRALIEQEQRARADEVRRAAVPGAVLTGRVASVREFGAFVDLGAGVQGLLHRSEMGWAPVADAQQAVAPGEEITVQVLRVDPDTGRIALGTRQLTEDPWTTVAARYEAGQLRPGRVTRHAPFGAFVELEPGVEALAHASTFPPGGPAGGWTNVVPIGSAGVFEVLEVDVERRRIGVAFVPDEAELPAATAGAPIAVGARLRGKVERVEPFGVFVFLAPGRTGLVPLAETGVAREADLRAAFPPGADVEVMVIDVDTATRRIRLSRKAALEAEQAEEVRQYRERETAAPSDGFGSLADKLRDALKKR